MGLYEHRRTDSLKLNRKRQQNCVPPLSELLHGKYWI
jgi:hypothetical protein